jgi:hypothetical protein
MPAADWSWWDAWKTGDPDEFQRALDAETDRSLDEDPGRWSWGKKVEDTVEEPTRAVPRQGGHGRHGRPGKGGQTERHAWSDGDWRAAKADYERQNAAYLRSQKERDRQLRDLAQERRDAAREVERRIRDQDRDDPGGGRGLFW